MINFLLRILDVFRKPFVLLGIDYEQLRNIVEVKFMLDARRPQAAMRNYRTKNEDSNKFLGVLLYYSVFGFITGSMVLLIQNSTLSIITILLAYLMFMIGFTLISDFAEVMIDTTDNLILLPRPINSRTLWAARMVHITFYLLLITLANSIGAVVIIAFKIDALFALLYLIFAFIIAIITVVLTSFLYALLIRFTSEQRLKDFISYAQIAFTIILMVGYQLIARVDIFTNNNEATIKWWHYLSPPSWFAHVFEDLHLGYYKAQTLPFVILILTVPIIGIVLMNKYLAGTFADKLSGFATGDGQSETPNYQVGIVKQQKFTWLGFWSNKLTSSPIEKSVFELVWKITTRDRKFKTRAYPIFGMLIYFGYNAISKPENVFNTYVLIYYGIIVVLSMASQIYYSDDHKAAWIYEVAPLASPKDIITGSKKAIITKTLLPVFLVLTPFLVYIVGWRVLDDIALGFCFSLVCCMFDIPTQKFILPFSKAVTEQTKASSSIVTIILALLMFPTVGGIHYLLATYTAYGVIIASPLIVTLAWFIYQEYDKINWQQVDY